MPLPLSEPLLLPPPGDVLPAQQTSMSTVNVISVEDARSRERTDCLVVEEPLAILLTYGPLTDRRRTTSSITMRTPGNDTELAVGYLFSEGLVSEPAQIVALEHIKSGSAVRVDLHPDVQVDFARMERQGFMSSACGVCGKTSIDAIEVACDGPRPGGSVGPALIHALPARLREHQFMFTQTGGLHAAALFDYSGNLLSLREDVGRHNAVDKLIGTEFMASRTPLHERIVLVSGRAGFELIQKAAIASIPIFAAVGAPSSLAVDLARRIGLTLIGFLREGRFNIYAGAERIPI